MYLHAYAGYNASQESCEDLKERIKREFGRGFKRVDRFIYLALYGALKLASRSGIASDASFLLTSGQGDLEVFMRLRAQIFEKAILPKPVDFINSLSNSAGFYVAQALGLSGKNLFVMHDSCAFEETLRLAALDMQEGREVVVGAVDALAEPSAMLRKLLGVDAGMTLGEGSSWFKFSPRKAGALGEVILPPREMNASELEAFLESLEPQSEVALNPAIDTATVARLKNRFPTAKVVPYGYFETLCAYALNVFLETGRGRFYHVGRVDDRYMVFGVEVY